MAEDSDAMTPSNDSISTTNLMGLGQSRPNPRELMRARHPDLFSDTVIESRNRLTREVFEYHLDTLTSRKQEYEFEHFCRKLAEKELCPNLRVQTGPTGGGDSKVDSETFPVATEISDRWWIGEPAAGSERWAFAFSAKKAWMPKIRSDVENVISTKRDYKRIYFFTNQFVSDKKRSKLEDELLNTSKIPVHIVDRSWIVERVFEHGHLELAIATLRIDGATVEKKSRVGALDLARISELDELDSQIIDPARYRGAHFQLVEDCLRSAILARSLEKPRHEVEGRFVRAERLAMDLENPRQMMRVAYNRAWTAHWWYEDYHAFIAYYAEVEKYVADSDDADDIEQLLNLWHLMIGIEGHGLVSFDPAESLGRQNYISTKLGEITKGTGRPNNALHAKTLLAFMNATIAFRLGDLQMLDSVWAELSQIVEDSTLMGQYPLETLADMVHELGQIADGEKFDALFEQLVNAMRQRKSDGEAGNAYLERGLQKLHQELPYEAIRWFGRAEELLVKEEYQKYLVMTLVFSSFAFERVGLLWAARSKILVAMEISLKKFFISGQMPAATLRIVHRLTWLEMQLGRLPQILLSMSWASFIVNHLKLTEEELIEYSDEIKLQEVVLGIHLLNIPLASLPFVEKLPDALERLGLTNARLALLFTLGQENCINRERYYPNKITLKECQNDFEMWRNQPAAKDIPLAPTLIEGKTTSVRSVILGSEFTIISPSEPTSLGIAESLLGALEAFLATSDETDVLPHSERTTIKIEKSKILNQIPTLSFDTNNSFDAVIQSPEKIEFSNSEDMARFSDWLRDSVLEIVEHRFIVRNAEKWLNRIGSNERAFSRAILLGNILTIGRNIFGRDPSIRLSDWFEVDDKIYECLRNEEWKSMATSTVTKINAVSPQTFASGPPPAELLDNARRKHTERQVMSPIDVPLWNQAKWCGTMFAMSEQQPPVLGIVFKNGQAGRSIFSAWKLRWGNVDFQDDLRVVIVTGISKTNPAHYAVAIGPNFNNLKDSENRT